MIRKSNPKWTNVLATAIGSEIWGWNHGDVAYVVMHSPREPFPYKWSASVKDLHTSKTTVFSEKIFSLEKGKELCAVKHAERTRATK